MSRRFLRLVAAMALLVLAPATACAGSTVAPGSSSVTVARVVDGDTLVLRGGARLRLLQIDAPEAGGECHSAASARELARLARPGTRVSVEADRRLDRVDRYGRLLRYVHVATTNVNVELVRRGAATPWFYRGERGRYADRLLSAVREAREAQRGMWGACRVTWSPTRAVETRPR